MPAINAPDKVLVTGANGFIAAWIIRTLLDHGYSVRGTVRAESKTTHLHKFFKNELEKGRVEFVVVPDLKDPSAFEAAMNGIDAILHTASPVTLKVDDPNELIEAAVGATLGVLEATLKYAGSRVKRIVITSSTAAVRPTPTALGTFNESDWDEGCLAEVEEKGREASPMAKYCASKTLAEKVAWDFVSKHKTKISWDLATICPPYVFGPILTGASSPSELNESMAQFYEAVFREGNLPESLEKFQANWVDVRDIALGHIRALEVPEAGGERFLVTNEPFVWQEWRAVANEFRGNPGATSQANEAGENNSSRYLVTYDGAKSRKVLGMEYRNKRETFKDIIKNRKAHGW